MSSTKGWASSSHVTQTKGRTSHLVELDVTFVHNGFVYGQAG